MVRVPAAGNPCGLHSSVRFRRKPLAVFHRVVTNPITSKFAAQLPGFGVIANVGRKSGKLYRTPVNVFRCEEGFLIALTYGRESGWVGNVVAAGSSELETRGVSYQLVSPKLNVIRIGGDSLFSFAWC